MLRTSNIHYIIFFSFLFILWHGVNLFSEDLHKEKLRKMEFVQNKEENQVGTVLSLRGKATVRDFQGRERTLKVGFPLYQGDRIETGKEAFLQAIFLDGSLIRLDKEGDFTVNEYYFHEEKGDAKSDISIDSAIISFLAGKISKIAPQNYKLRTATATIGIRGSSGELVARDGSSGEMVFTKVRVAKGHAIEVESDFGIFLLDDPTRALEVTPLEVSWFDVSEASWLEESSGEKLDEGDEENIEEEEEEENKEGVEEEKDEEDKESAEEEKDQESRESVEEEKEREGKKNGKKEQKSESLKEKDENPLKKAKEKEEEPNKRTAKKISRKDQKSEERVEEGREKGDSLFVLEEDMNESFEGGTEREASLAISQEKNEKEFPLFVQEEKEEIGFEAQGEVAKSVIKDPFIEKSEWTSFEASLNLLNITENIIEEITNELNEEKLSSQLESVHSDLEEYSIRNDESDVEIEDANVEEVFIEEAPPVVIVNSEYFRNTNILIDGSDGSSFTEREINFNSEEWILPEIWKPNMDAYKGISNVSLGYKGVCELEPSDIKVGNLLMSGDLTSVNEEGAFLQEKLNLSGKYSYYTGFSFQSLKLGASEEVKSLGFTSMAIVSDDAGDASTRFRGLSFFPEQGIIIGLNKVRGEVDSQELSSEMVMYSIFGGNKEEFEEGFFFSELNEKMLMDGKYAGPNAENIYYSYSRDISETGEYVEGGGIVLQTDSTDQSTVHTKMNLEGYSAGIILDSEEDRLISEENTRDSFTLSGEAGFTLNFLLYSYLGGVAIDEASDAGDVEIMISKDAFFTDLELDTEAGANHLEISSLDVNNSFLSGLPGLNDFENIGWGIWALQEAGDRRVFGYISYGIEGNETSIEDLQALKSNGDFYVNYKGSAMGSIFEVGEIPHIQFGQTEMNINFSTGVINGSVNFKDDIINLSKNPIEEFTGFEPVFQGNAQINGEGSGYFRTQFFGENAIEAAGTFGVESGVKRAVGAFGVKKTGD